LKRCVGGALTGRKLSRHPFDAGVENLCLGGVEHQLFGASEVRRLFDLAYIGVSAGAALAGSDMALLIAADGPGTVTDTARMALVPFVIIPHVNRRPAEDFANRQRLFETTDLMPLNDDQAIMAMGNAVTMITSP